MRRWMRAAGLAFGAVFLTARVSAQQSASVEAVWSRYVAELQRGESGPGDAATISIMLQRSPWTAADRARLEQHLRDFIRSSPDARSRYAAVQRFAEGGVRDATPPVPGRVTELRALHAASTDPRVRAAVVSAMSRQVEQAEAVDFLVSLATRPPGPHDDVNTPSQAVSVLNGMAPAGQTALDRLARERRVTDPDARRNLELFQEVRGRPAPK